MTRPPTAEPPPIEHIRAEVRRALGEDLGDGDVTATLIDPTTTGSASIVCREPAVICGVSWVEEVFRQMDANIGLVWHTRDGDRVPADTTLCRLQGPARALVTGERTALNFLQLLSGVATTAQRYADAVAGTATRILDTRKTLPGLRRSQKYAVRCGGCLNHRMGLYDAVLIKENHIAAAGSITAAVASIRTRHPELPVEVEAETFAELDEALAAGADIVMLDNFTLADLHQAVIRTAGRARLEVSGNVGLAALAEIAATGVDYISTGALTKHVQAIDLSMRFDPPAGSTDR